MLFLLQQPLPQWQDSPIRGVSSLFSVLQITSSECSRFILYLQHILYKPTNDIFLFFLSNTSIQTFHLPRLALMLFADGVSRNIVNLQLLVEIKKNSKNLHVGLFEHGNPSSFKTQNFYQQGSYLLIEQQNNKKLKPHDIKNYEVFYLH